MGTDIDVDIDRISGCFHKWGSLKRGFGLLDKAGFELLG